MIGLWLGADLLVNGASEIAILFGISETVVGLTVVAAGTGAPELFASIAALRKNSTGIALGNILGSNIFNTLGIKGSLGFYGKDITKCQIDNDEILFFFLNILHLIAIFVTFL